MIATAEVNITKIKWLKGLGDGHERSSIIEIGPKRATELMENNLINVRPMNESRTQSFCDIIHAGQWKVTHQGIALDNLGCVIDGQHRIKGILLSGQTVPIRVTWNMSRDVTDAIDTGKSRQNRYVVSEIDSRTVQGISYYLEVQGISNCQPYQIRQVMETPIGHAIDMLTKKCGANVRQRAQSPIKLGAAIRYLEDPEYVAKNWRAFLLLDFPEMSHSVQAFLRMLTANKWMPQITRRHSLMIRAWLAFNPGRQDMQRIDVKDEVGYLTKLRELVPLEQ